MNKQLRITIIFNFLDSHFAGRTAEEEIEVRTIHSHTRQATSRFFRNTHDASVYAVDAILDNHVYFGVNPRRNQDGSKEGVSRVFHLHADVDFKHFGGEAEAAMAQLDDFPLEPSCIVYSGGGYQAYWRFEEPLARDYIPQAESLMQRLYHYLGGLDRVQDASRIFRLPGTTNWKPEYPDHPTVRVVTTSPATYTLDDFERVLPPLPEAPKVFEWRKSAESEPPPSLDELRSALATIDPVDPYEDGDGYNGWVKMLMAVHSAYPGQEGYDLVDEWSTEKRTDAGCHGTLVTQPEKWDGFKRSEAPGSVGVGTLFKLAKGNGWEQPKKGPTLKRKPPPPPPPPRWRVLLDQYPALERDEMPYWLRRWVQFLEPSSAFAPHDWPEMLALSGMSMLFPNVWFENLGVNLWFLGVAEQGFGKGLTLNDTSAVILAVSESLGLEAKTVHIGSPEGFIGALEGDNRVALALHDEFEGVLANMGKGYGDGLRSLLCTVYDRSRIGRTLTRGDVVGTNPHVTVLGVSAQRLIVPRLTEEDVRGGYMSRFWFVAPDPHEEDYASRSFAERTAFAIELSAHVQPLQDIRRARFNTPLGMDPPAYREYKLSQGIGTGNVRTFEDGLRETRLPAGRRIARVKKVATLLELLEQHPTHHQGELLVSEENVRRAIRLVERGGAYGERLLAHVGSGEEDRVANEILALMAKKYPDGTTVRQLQGSDKVATKSNIIKTAMETLVDAGHVEGPVKVGKKAVYRLARGE